MQSIGNTNQKVIVDEVEEGFLPVPFAGVISASAAATFVNTYYAVPNVMGIAQDSLGNMVGNVQTPTLVGFVGRVSDMYSDTRTGTAYLRWSTVPVTL